MGLAHFNNRMNQIETRIAELVNWVRVDGAYCCRLQSVRDMVEKPATVLVMMRCQYQDASFEVHYGSARGEAPEEDDAILKRRIALGIVKIFARTKMNERLT